MTSRFGARNYLYVLPLLLLMFLATFSLNPVPDAGVKEQSGHLKILIIATYSVSLIFLLFNFQAVLSILKGRWLYAFFMLYIAASVVWSDDPASTLRMSAYFWGGAVVSLVAVVAFRNNPLRFFQALILYSVVMLGGSLATVLLNPARGIAEGGRWIGWTTHPNILGIVSLIAVWASITLFCMTRSKTVKVFTIGVKSLAGICLYGANSATSFVVSAAVVALTLVLRSVDTTRITRLFAQAAGVGFFVALCASVLYVLVPELFSVEAMFGMIGRNTTFTGRTALWDMGLAKIAQDPIIGSGFQEYINVSGTQIKHFHSGYIELLVRGGIIAMAFVIAFVFQIVFSIKRFSDPKLYLFFAIMTMAILVHNVTEGSFGRGVNALWLIFSFIYFYTDKAAKGHMQSVAVQKAHNNAITNARRHAQIDGSPRPRRP